MDAETKALLLKYLEVGADRLERGAAFVEAEIPLVVQEYLSWYWWENMLGVLFNLLLLVGVFFIAKAGVYSFKKLGGVDYDMDSNWWFGLIGSTVIGLVLGIISTISLSLDVCNLIKVSVAPRVVILEKIAEVAK